MRLISSILVGVVALQHLFFLVLEMFLWTKPLGLKIFELTPEQAIAWAKQQGPEVTFHHFPLGGGTPPRLGWPSLELYADEVLPYLD